MRDGLLIMRRVIRYISIVILTALIMLTTAGCKDEVVTDIVLRDDEYIVEQYFESIDDYKKLQYEQIVNSLKYFDIGPHEPTYRGIIYLTDDEISELYENYEWTETDTEFEFDMVDISGVEGPWYTCTEFNRDNFKIINCVYCVFNGEAMVFELHVT